MRAWIYDRAFAGLTKGWYRSVLESLEPGTRLLDVGIGTASPIAANAEIVKSRDLHIHGIDIDQDYVKQALAAVEQAGLSDRVTVALESVYDHQGGPYDAVYFGASFMLMPDPQGALRHVMTRLRPGGRIYFTQTFQQTKSPFLEKLKPMLVKFTTIDFGRVTYEEDFLKVVGEAGMDVLSNDELHRRGAQSFRRVVGQPRAEAAAAR
jgi:ubiquinone/menaquinone biosynthesis C-methylase UbiE